MANSVISKITLPSGTTYDIKDEQARSDIASLMTSVTGAMHYIGISTTAITDGGTENASIGGSQKTMTASDSGSVVIYGEKEYVWNGSKWQEFGSTGSLKALAFKDSASASYTPAGSVSQPTFSNGSVTASGKLTPAGSVTVTTKTTANKTAAVSPTTGTITYTPAGSVALNYPQIATIKDVMGANPTDSHPATYTPAGTVSAPTISVKTAGGTTTIKNPTSVTVAKTVVAAAPGSAAPSNSLTYYSVSGETLSLYQLGYTTGASITTSNVTVKNGDPVYEATAPEFTGAGVWMSTNIQIPDSATFTGTGVRLVTGNIAVPDSYTASFTGTEGNVSVSGTATGTVSKPSFTGTAATITVS